MGWFLLSQKIGIYNRILQFIITWSNDFLNIIDNVLSKAVTLLCVKVELTAAIVVIVVVVSTATALVVAAVVVVIWIYIIFKVHLGIKEASNLKTIQHHT